MNMLVCILSFSLLQMTVDAQVTISADKSLPRDGETVSLTCYISAFKVPATWSVKNTGVGLTVCPPSGSCVPPNDAARYTYSATASSIGVTITAFNSMQDTFGWRCQYGTNYAVHVIKPAIPVTTVQLTKSSGETLTSTINVVRGGITDIRCSTAPNGSRPRAIFRWYNRSVEKSPVLIEYQSISSTPDSEPGQQESDIVLSYSTLTLTGNASYHNMYILCEARDETSTGDYIRSGEAQINILYPPVVQLSPNNSMYNVTEGTQNFVFTCNLIEANPSPQSNGYSWLHRSLVIQGQTSFSYTIPNVHKSDDGEYICTAKNEHGNGTSNALALNVQYPVKIITFFAKGNSSEIMENRTLELYCHVDSNPYSDISLTFGDVLTSTTQDSNELIHNVTAGCLHAGKYICSATNSIMNGVNVSAEINLKVKCHPRFDFRRNISVVYYRALNDNVTLEGSVIAYPEPTNIMWYHRALETYMWQRVPNQSFSSVGLDFHIFVHLGSHRDFGDYLVNMSNSFGIYELIFHVIPKTPSTSESHGIPVAGIAGGIIAGIVIILVVVIVIFLFRRYQHTTKNEHENDATGQDEEGTKRNQMEDMSVIQDVTRGKEYDGLSFKKTEATQDLQLNDITLEENRDHKTRSPEVDSYETLHLYANSDIRMYSSLKIPKKSKDSEAKYENIRIKQPE